MADGKQRPQGVGHPGNLSRIGIPDSAGTTAVSLLDRVRDGQPDAWKRLVWLYGPVVNFWLRRLRPASRQDLFQEVFVAVFQGIGRFSRREGRGVFRGWLKTVTERKIADHFRQLGRHPVAFGGSTALLRLHQEPARPATEEADREPSPATSQTGIAATGTADLAGRPARAAPADVEGAAPDAPDAPDGPAGDRVERAALAQRAAELVRRDVRPEVWLAYYRTAVDGQNATQVAEELGMKPATVRQHKRRVLGRLREELRQLEEELGEDLDVQILDV